MMRQKLNDSALEFFAECGRIGGKLGGALGGKKAAENMTDKQKRARALKAVRAREKKRKRGKGSGAAGRTTGGDRR